MGATSLARMLKMYGNNGSNIMASMGGVPIMLSGFNDVAPIGFLAVTGTVPFQQNDIAAANAQAISAGWGTARASAFTAAMQTPPKFRAWVDRSGMLRTSITSSSFTSSSAVQGAGSYLDRLIARLPDAVAARNSVNSTDGWSGFASNTATAPTIAQAAQNAAKALGLDVDGWTQQPFSAWSPQLVTNGVSLSSGPWQAVTGDTAAFSMATSTLGFNYTGAQPAVPSWGTSSLCNNAASTTGTPWDFLSGDPNTVALVVMSTINLATPSYIGYLYTRLRRVEDGDIGCYFVPCFNTQAKNVYASGSLGTASPLSQIGTYVANGGRPASAAAGSSGFVALRAAGNLVYPTTLPGTLPIPGLVWSMVAGLPMTAEYNAYGVGGDTSEIISSIGAVTSVTWADGTVVQQLAETGRSALVLKGVLTSMMSGMLSGLTGSDLASAQANIASLSTAPFNEVLARREAAPVSVALANVILARPLAAISSDPSDWATLTFPQANGSTPTYAQLQGSQTAYTRTAQILSGDVSIAPWLNQTEVVINADANGNYTFSQGGLAISQTDASLDVIAGTAYAFTGTATFLGAFGVPDLPTLQGQNSMGVAAGGNTAAGMSEDILAFSDDPDAQLRRGFMDVIGQRQALAAMAFAVDFYNLRVSMV